MYHWGSIGGFEMLQPFRLAIRCWDDQRIGGTTQSYQQSYRLIQFSGDYIPRKATRFGFKTRHLPTPVVGRRFFYRSALAPRTLYRSRLRRNE
jgi:hypothetical protein